MPKPLATQRKLRSGEMGFGLEEIDALISCPQDTSGGSSSFTALLELPPPQAVELLVNEDFPAEHPPIFSSDALLIDRASMFSVFDSAHNLPESKSFLPVSSSMKIDAVKKEPLDSSPSVSNQSLMAAGKRKEREKKVEESDKKSKKLEANEGSDDGVKQLPYVHVRARRGQATNSHSLAERARREKINARMKLLQELVPGCNKISGTAMVLDEIINHVQALQRQVEFLSMRLAAVNPRIDFNLDALLATESGISIDNGYTGVFSPSILAEEQIHGCRQPQYEQLVHSNELDETVWDKGDNSNFLTPDNSILSYDSANSGVSALKPAENGALTEHTFSR
ncbi:hypothetical protein CASFOL_019591 [Castilleja foliolosa]|uniref:BHLH domain-containing protein n=1 Tax=Castilleja foliolosa TaxID=1961234 RepID=A0ABD3D964_9LAMI